MGKRGPKPKPTAIKKLAGNPGKRKLNKAEPQPTAGIPPRPECLDDIGAAEWDRVVPELARLGLLTLVDRAALACYCCAWADLVHARKTLGEEGQTFQTDKGYVVPHPCVSIAAAAATRIKAFCAEFGLTPSARARMTLPDGPKPADPLDEFLGR
jgi:P27 family predicted phage terminase small subunit